MSHSTAFNSDGENYEIRRYHNALAFARDKHMMRVSRWGWTIDHALTMRCDSDSHAWDTTSPAEEFYKERYKIYFTNGYGSDPLHLCAMKEAETCRRPSPAEVVRFYTGRYAIDRGCKKLVPHTSELTKESSLKPYLYSYLANSVLCGSEKFGIAGSSHNFDSHASIDVSYGSWHLRNRDGSVNVPLQGNAGVLIEFKDGSTPFWEIYDARKLAIEMLRNYGVCPPHGLKPLQSHQRGPVQLDMFSMMGAN